MSGTYDNLAGEALANRKTFAQAGVYMLDIVASPRAGKTSVVLAIIEELRDEFNIGVVVGDGASRADVATFLGQGIAAVRADGDGRSLDARGLWQAASQLDLDNLDLMLVENVSAGPEAVAADLGQTARLALVSVAEAAELVGGVSRSVAGAAVPADSDPRSVAEAAEPDGRVPRSLLEADVIALNKVDTSARFGFDFAAFCTMLTEAGCAAPIFSLSATTGQGTEELVSWLKSQMHQLR